MKSRITRNVFASRIPLLTLACIGAANGVVKASETLTGAQLASDPRVTFPTYAPAVSGSSLIVGPGDLDFAKFVDVRLGTFAYTDVVEVKLNLTVLTADYDPKFVLSDGIRMYGIAIGDDNGGTMNYIRFSDNGNRGGYDGSDAGFQNGGWPPIGQSFDLTVRFKFSATSSTAYGAYGNASGQFTTPQQYIDPHRELHFDILQDNEDVEQYQINSLTLSVPQITALYYTGAASNGLNAAGNYTRDLAGSLVSPVAPDAGTDVFFTSSNALTSRLNATIGTNLSVNSLTFGTGVATTNGVSISGPGTLTINAGAIGYAAGTGIVKQTGSAAVTIDAPIAISASQNWTNSSATALTVNGNVGLGANTLTLAGNGSTAINGVISGSGALAVTASGVTNFSGSNTYSGGTSVNNKAANLHVSPAASVPLLNGNGTNIANGRVTFEYNGSNPVQMIRSLLTIGYGNGFVSGVLRSSTATASRGLGYKDTGTTVIVMATLYGDADLDGDVDFNDFLVLQSNYNSTNTRFDQGNFNYDGVTDFNDFLTLQSNFGQSIGGDTIAVTTEQIAALTAFGLTNAVPEPALLTTAGLGLSAVLRRSRRNGAKASLKNRPSES